MDEKEYTFEEIGFELGLSVEQIRFARDYNSGMTPEALVMLILNMPSDSFLARREAAILAQHWLDNERVSLLVNVTLYSGGLNDDLYKAQLLNVITQNANIPAKVSALKLYDKVTKFSEREENRYNKTGIDIARLTDTEANVLISLIEKAMGLEPNPILIESSKHDFKNLQNDEIEEAEIIEG